MSWLNRAYEGRYGYASLIRDEHNTSIANHGDRHGDGHVKTSDFVCGAMRPGAIRSETTTTVCSDEGRKHDNSTTLCQCQGCDRARHEDHTMSEQCSAQRAQRLFFLFEGDDDEMMKASQLGFYASKMPKINGVGLRAVLRTASGGRRPTSDVCPSIRHWLRQHSMVHTFGVNSFNIHVPHSPYMHTVMRAHN